MSKILIVDDDLTSAGLVDRHLQSFGFHTIVASSGSDALSVISNEQPSLLIVDLNMPGVDGWEIIRRVRGDASTAAIAIIATSGYYAEDEIDLAAIDCDRYHRKPIDLAKLTETIEELLIGQGEGDSAVDAA